MTKSFSTIAKNKIVQNHFEVYERGWYDMKEFKILVVDDSPTALRMMTRPFLNSGYEVLTATNGEEALKKTETENPDLIVMDVIMPKLNGFQVCRKIKSDPNLSNIPIILLSNKDKKSDIFWGLKQGASSYMTKPFLEEQLLSTAEELLGLTI